MERAAAPAARARDAAGLPKCDPALNTRLRAAVRAITARDPIYGAPVSSEPGGRAHGYVPAAVERYLQGD